MSLIQVIRDPFKNTTDKLAAAGSGINGTNFIRRPTRGTELKEDTFATIRVAVSTGDRNIPLVDAGSRRTAAKFEGKTTTDVYSNFLLQQVQEERMEKQQILETFGEAYIFLFGERARVITFQGVLLNTFDFNWEAEWWFNYDNFLRGTRCVENDARAYISFDTTLVGGYIIGSNASKNAVDKNHVTFQFQMFVTSYNNFSAIGDPTAHPGFSPTAQSPTFQPITDNASAAQFRPTLIPANQSTQGTPPTTLADGLLAGIQQVTNTWNQAADLVNSTFTGIGIQLSGNVRVPIGFAGTMAFDDKADVNLYTVNFGESIKYSVFSDNDDEYVGVGDHYGSSTVPMDFGFIDPADRLTYNQGLVDQATKIWAKAGFVVPPALLGPVSAFIVSKGTGLLSVGAPDAWSAFSHTTVPGSADGPFGAGLQSVLSLPE